MKLVISIAVIVIIGFILVTSGFYTVGDQERVVITTFGRYTSTQGAGPHLMIPIVQRRERVSMITNGFRMGWQEDEGRDISNSVGYGYVVKEEALMITKDFNLVLADLYVEWRVTDPVKYLFASDDPVSILQNIIQGEERRIINGYDVDDALTSAKGEIQMRIRENVNNALDKYDIGVTTENITLQDVEPPSEEVSTAFRSVENAKQAKDTALNEARAYANEKLPAARADADAITKSAEAKKEERIQEANGQVSRFNDLFDEYKINKDVTRLRLYLEAMEEILPDARVYVQDPEGVIKTITME